MKMKGPCPKPMYNCVDWVLHTSGVAMFTVDIIDLYIYTDSLSEGDNTAPCSNKITM